MKYSHVTTSKYAAKNLKKKTVLLPAVVILKSFHDLVKPGQLFPQSRVLPICNLATIDNLMSRNRHINSSIISNDGSHIKYKVDIEILNDKSWQIHTQEMR